MNARVGMCAQCGHDHPTVADVWACNAIHGRGRDYPLEVRDPELVCRLCHHLSHASLMIGAGGHFAIHHDREEIRTGHLVSLLVDALDIAAVPVEVPTDG